jgi:hypothetical protein
MEEMVAPFLPFPVFIHFLIANPKLAADAHAPAAS